MKPKIETQRLILRPFSAEDRADACRVATEPHVAEWMSDWEDSLIDNFISQYDSATRDNMLLMLAVTDKYTGEYMGLCGVGHIGHQELFGSEVEIGYHLSHCFTGKGYMTEAVKALSQWTFKQFGYDYLIAVIEPGNLPSQRVVERSGYCRHSIREVPGNDSKSCKTYLCYHLDNPQSDEKRSESV